MDDFDSANLSEALPEIVDLERISVRSLIKILDWPPRTALRDFAPLRSLHL